MKKVRLEVKNLYFSRGEREVLKNISFVVTEGEIVGIVGPNGSGKTTLLKLLDNLIPSESGEIILNGKNIKDYSCKELAKHISFMNQNTSVSFDFPCRDIVVLGRYPYLEKFQEYSKEDMRKAEKYMELTNTLKFKNKSIMALSGGERQRVLFAKTLTQEGDIMLLDEPTASLDMKYEEEIFKIVEEQRELGKTTIAVIHNLRTAIKYCTKIILIHEGKVFKMGTPEEVITEENLKTAYGIEVKVYDNLLNGRLDFCLV